MSSTFFHQPASLYGCGGSIDVPAGGSYRLFSKLLSPRFIPHKLHPVLASTSHVSAIDHTSSHSISHHSPSKQLFFLHIKYRITDKLTDSRYGKLIRYIFLLVGIVSLYFVAESTLILIRHGESMWNEKNLFTGCCDVPLTRKGVEEAVEAGKRISYIPVDMIFTSGLIRAQMTAMLAMTQHHEKKVPIITHNESEQATTWSQVYSERTTKQSIPVITTWQLNERMYGDLQGLNKKETAERYGKEQVHEWRRSYDISPPNGESLEMCSQRAVAYFKDFIEPQLKSGKHVLVAAHANSLRSIIMYLDRLTSQEVASLELSTGIPLLYIYKEGKFSSRGSPVGPTEAGVYAYTQSLAVYRQQLDEMSH